MLNEFEIHPSLAASDVDRARTWYAEKLGLNPILEYEDLLKYTIGDSVFTVYETQSAGTAKNTVAMENVPDLRAEVARLKARGVVFEDYDLPGLYTEDGIADTGDGGLLAWFKDSEGNIVGLAQWPGDDRPPGITAMIAAADLPRARAWYADKLGLTPAQEMEGALNYRSGASSFTVYATEFAGTAKNTVAVWRVPDLGAEMTELRGRGVVFEDYDFGDWRTVDGVMTDPEGGLAAWFTDLEGNVLGLAQEGSAPVS
ncbi:MAG TPA: VOC family protein [Candidatus Eisenbacteria bacterium]|nr:VOC family protein [Candidatus Eisenbacteria bacterium]